MKRIVCFLLCLIILSSIIPVSVVAQTPKLVALTFDDGPSKYTETLVDGLAARGAKATFFIVGNMAASRMSTIHRMVNEGHQIANHTTSHPNLARLSAENVSNQLAGCRYYLVQAAGEQTFCLRPPYGSYNLTVQSVANMPIITWSVDTLDWKYRNADSVYNKIMNNTKDGSIVLLHDLYSTSVTGALRAIDSLKAQGYEFVTIEELFRRRAVTLENGKVYSSAYNHGITLPNLTNPVITTESVYGGKQITITCDTPDAQIYYTTDGSDPTISSNKYTEPFKVGMPTTVRAISYCGYQSEIISRYVWAEPATEPVIKYENGILTLTPADATTIYYITDGSEANYSSAVYTEPIPIERNANLLITALGKGDKMIHLTLTLHGKLLRDIHDMEWYYPYVSDVINYGLMNGVSQYEFAPFGNVTRAMFTTVLHRMSSDFETQYSPATFGDIDNSSWYTEAVAWAQSTGITQGISPTEFAPDNQITREEMCTMLSRFFTYYEYAFPLKDAPNFNDNSAISDWALESVLLLSRAGIINGTGDGNFTPKSLATRAECAKIVTETYKLINVK